LRYVEERDIADAGMAFGRGWNPVEWQGEQRYRWIAREGRVFFQRPAGAALAMDAEVGTSQGREPLLVEILDGSGAVAAAARVEGRARLRLRFPDGVEAGAFTVCVHGRGIPLYPELRLLHLRVRELRWESGQAGSGEWRLQVTGKEAGTDWAATLQAPAPDAARMGNAACLHSNANGDFTLLAREDWFRLRGYAEFPIWPVHVDLLLCYVAHHAGMREVTLRDPLRMFHIEHSSGAGWTPEGEDALNARVQRLRVPVLDFDADLRLWVQQMRRLNAPVIFNLGNWGLGDEELPERSG
jgi:hypothetical protein